MPNDPVRLEVELIPSASLDKRVVEQQTVDLARELRGVRGVEVDRVRTEAPADAKALDLAAIGSLLVSLGGAGGAITALIGVLQGWMGREAGRTIRLRIGDRELELTGASRDEEQKLIDAFIRG